MWATLRHPNVLPLLGVTLSKNHFAMVSEWMENGNITEFVETHREVNPFGLVRSCCYCWPPVSLMITSDSSKMLLGV